MKIQFDSSQPYQQRHELMINGIEYEKTVGETFWDMTLFEDDNLKSYFQDCIAVKKIGVRNSDC